VKIKHDESSRLTCSTCGAESPGYDCRKRRWRHLDTCQYKTILECDVPRVECATHGVVQAKVPWAEPGSRFTAMFEALVIDWLHEASISGVAKLLKLSWDEVDGVMSRAVERGLVRRGNVACTQISVDEKARASRHAYVTIVVDHDNDGRVVYVGTGRKKNALESFFEQIGADACAKIKSIAMDMWPAFIEATRRFVPGADRKIAFDRFHVAQHIGNAVDQVRRNENRQLIAQGNDALKGSRYLWGQRKWFEAFVEWTEWQRKALRTKLAPMIKVAHTVCEHLWGIANAISLNVCNAKSESYNAAVQKISSRAHGFRNDQRFANAIYFHLGRLSLYPDGFTARP
jgi:transposase